LRDYGVNETRNSVQVGLMTHEYFVTIRRVRNYLPPLFKTLLSFVLIYC